MMKRRTFMQVVTGALVACGLRPAGRAEAIDLSADTEKLLTEAEEIDVATRRKSGKRSSAAPIWFLFHEGDIYTTTAPGSWKAKRIANGSPMYIWVGSQDGPFFIGEPEVIDDPKLIDWMGEQYNEKYWIAWLGFFRPRSERVTGGQTIAYRVKLSEGEPPPAA